MLGQHLLHFTEKEIGAGECGLHGSNCQPGGLGSGFQVPPGAHTDGSRVPGLDSYLERWLRNQSGFIYLELMLFFCDWE